MPKQKTHKGLAKRVKVTGSGKVRRHRSGHSHLLSNKNAKRKRRLGQSTLVKGLNASTIKSLVGG
ncbi:MAG: 50S ribosomal protein L35 [Sedimentisphaerales bacterium]|nr:50S ribosomal protein L35 [Sedimentisphaerales bacterium]